jgi:hypothetical protein
MLTSTGARATSARERSARGGQECILPREMYPPFKIHLGYIPDTMYLNPQIYMTQKTHSRYMLDTYGIHRDTSRYVSRALLAAALGYALGRLLGPRMYPACIPHVSYVEKDGSCANLDPKGLAVGSAIPEWAHKCSVFLVAFSATPPILMYGNCTVDPKGTQRGVGL